MDVKGGGATTITRDDLEASEPLGCWERFIAEHMSNAFAQKTGLPLSYKVLML